MRSHFDFPATGRVVTNNAATTQTPRELVDLYRSLSPWYESVHRGQSTASQRITGRFEESYDTIATWLNAPRLSDHGGHSGVNIARLELVPTVRIPQRSKIVSGHRPSPSL